MTASRERAFGTTGGAYPGHWVGRFIWTDDDPYAFHYFVMARCEVDLETAVESAVLHVTCNDRYVLYVNGQYLGRGPARSDCRWKSFDTYDVSEGLRGGTNAIAILGYRYGCTNAYTRDDRAGLFAQLDLSFEGGATQTLGTGEDWRLLQAKAWRQDVKPMSPCVGVTEVYDARDEAPGWTEAGFDDSAWSQATLVPLRLSPWSVLEPRQTPLMAEREIFPVRIVEVGEVQEDTSLVGDSDVPERLAMEPHLPLEMARIAHADEMLGRDGGAMVRSAPCRRGDPRDLSVRSPYVVFDFGQHVYGFPRIDLAGPAAGVVEMTYGPELIGGRILPIAGHVRYGDRYVMREGDQVWRQFEGKQFRYLQVVFRNVAQAAFVRSVSLISYEYPSPRRGSFECSDPILTTTWKAAIDTTFLQMEDTIVCDAVRERSSWGGDGAHGEYAVWAGFGDAVLCDWHFRLLFRGQMADGMLAQRYPCTQARLGGGGAYDSAEIYDNPHCIPQHALVLAVMLTGEYYHTFGRTDLLGDLYPALLRLVAWCERHEDDSGLVYGLGNWQWMDWTLCDMRGAHFGTNAFYRQLLANLAVVAADLGEESDARGLAARSERVANSLRRLHWDAERGFFVDSVLDGQQSEVATELTNALSILFRIAEPDQKAVVLSQLNSAESPLVPPTPLFVYYLLEALAAAGDARSTYDRIRTWYGPMVTYDDAPAICEAWAPHTLVLNTDSDVTSQSMIPSRTHSGGVGVAWTLSKLALGVTCDATGPGRCRIQPQTGSLDWARGVVPSVWGDIEVSWTRDDGLIRLEVALPDGLQTELALPRPAGCDATVLFDGRTVAVGTTGVSAERPAGSDEQVVIEVTGGRHSLEVQAA